MILSPLTTQSRINKFLPEPNYTQISEKAIQKGQAAYNSSRVSVPATREKEDFYSFIRRPPILSLSIEQLRINKFLLELSYTLISENAIQSSQAAYNLSRVSVPATRKKEDFYSFIRRPMILSPSIEQLRINKFLPELSCTLMSENVIQKSGAAYKAVPYRIDVYATPQ